MSIDESLFAELTKVAHGMRAGAEKSKLVRLLITGRRHLDGSKIASTSEIRDRLVRLAHESDPATRQRLMPLVLKVNVLSKQAKGWSKLPKGWTQDSVKKLWASLSGDRKHKVTACIKKMTGKVDDAGGFCAGLADMVEPGWRENRASVLPVGAKITGFEYQGEKTQFYFDSNQTIVVNMDGGDAKTAAAIHDLESLPYVGDIVESVEANLGLGNVHVRFSSGRSVVVHTSTENWSPSTDVELAQIQGKKKGDKDKKSESDIEPTHARKEWPELPPGVKAASVGAAAISVVLAKVFHNDDALKSYLKLHPKADPSKHTVKGKPGGGKEKSEDKPGGKGKLKDLSGQPGFSKLKGLSPEKQQEVIQRALEMGKPEGKRKPVQKDVSDQFSVLKGLSPNEQRKVIERALKMASFQVFGFSEGDKVVLTEPYKGPGGALHEGESATVSGVGSGPAHDMVTLTLDAFCESHSLTTGIAVPPKVLTKQACGCDCQCGGSCSTAKHHVDQFVSDNPDLSEKLAEVTSQATG